MTRLLITKKSPHHYSWAQINSAAARSCDLFVVVLLIDHSFLQLYLFQIHKNMIFFQFLPVNFVIYNTKWISEWWKKIVNSLWHRLIFCQKIYFFPGRRKNCKKIFPIFFTFRCGKLSKIALSRLQYPVQCWLTDRIHQHKVGGRRLGLPPRKLHKEMALETIGGSFITLHLHLVACMESNNWLMNWCLCVP